MWLCCRRAQPTEGGEIHLPLCQSELKHQNPLIRQPCCESQVASPPHVCSSWCLQGKARQPQALPAVPSTVWCQPGELAGSRAGMHSRAGKPLRDALAESCIIAPLAARFEGFHPRQLEQGFIPSPNSPGTWLTQLAQPEEGEASGWCQSWLWLREQ